MGSGIVCWGETPGEPLVGRIFRFPAREDARPTHRLAKLCHYRKMSWLDAGRYLY
jgi:hypothetical protein